MTETIMTFSATVITNVCGPSYKVASIIVRCKKKIYFLNRS